MAKVFELAKLYSLAGFVPLALPGPWAFAELATPVDYKQIKKYINFASILTSRCRLDMLKITRYAGLMAVTCAI